jgi:tetratricopeptide (TPR) repeat protein
MSLTDKNLQPVSLDETPPHGMPPVDVDVVESSGPGCFLWGVVGVLGLGFAVVIVALSGAAGWTSGQRQAQSFATATQQAEIQDQMNRIPGDVVSGNTVLLNARLQFLATQTPGVPGLGAYMETATAVFMNALPTETPLPSNTPEATEAVLVPEETEAVEIQIEQNGSGYDLPGLLEQARTAARLGQYTEAADLLQVIEAVDSTYESAEVRGLMLESLTAEALRLFRGGGNLAEAILLTDEAEKYGLPADSELRYESYVAALYLNARSKIGTDFGAAILALQEAYNVAPNYRDGELRNLLFGQLVAYGDAWVAEGNPCAAVSQYQSALTIIIDGGVDAKRSNAETACQQGTPVPGPDGQTIAPVGVPATPGS